MKCPVCKNENPAGAKFCIKCGARFSQTCPKCGAGNLAEAAYCEQCGASLAPAETRRTARRRTPYVAAFIGALLALAAIAVVALFVGPALDLWPSVWATPTAIPPTPEPHALADDEAPPDSGENIEALPAEPLQDAVLVPAEIESRGEWIAYVTREADDTFGLWVVRPDGEAPNELVNYAEWFVLPSSLKGEQKSLHALFAPKGNYMLFGAHVGGEYSLYSYALGEEEAQRIVHSEDSLEYWLSSNGDRLSVEVYESGESTLLIMDVDGEDQVTLLEPVEGRASAEWLPNGRRWIVWFYDQGEYSLLLMDDRGVERITLADDMDDVNYIVSSEGDKIAYAAAEGGEWDVYVADADGSNAHPIEEGLAQVRLLRFSPDGRQLLMSASTDGDWYNLYVVETIGTKRVALTSDVEEADGGFCPGGRRIWFVIWDGEWWNLYLADASGEDEVLIRGLIDDYQMEFTPDGRTMVVSLRNTHQYDLYAVEVATGEQVHLINTKYLGLPAVMDNNRVLFSAGDDYEASLYIARLDGEDTLEVAGPVDGIYGYDISPDGRRIVYSEETSGEYRLYLIDIDGSNQEELADDGLLAAWSD